MSDIVRRTVFYHRVNGVVKFLDWAVVTFNNNESGLRRMVEPFMVNNRYGLKESDLVDHDASDPMCRIDYMQKIQDADSLNAILSGNSPIALHGGLLTPTVGRGSMFNPDPV